MAALKMKTLSVYKIQNNGLEISYNSGVAIGKAVQTDTWFIRCGGAFWREKTSASIAGALRRFKTIVLLVVGTTGETIRNP